MNVDEFLRLYSAGERSFHEVDLSGAKLCGVNILVADLSGANLSGADLSRANLSFTNLSGANLSGADLSRAELGGTRIDDKTQLDNKWFLVWVLLNEPIIKPILRGADLSDAHLYGINFSEADLSEADLSGANLSRANLRESNLCGANLSDALLSEADLSGANLSRANLSKTILGQTKFCQANLRKANFCEATFNDTERYRDSWQMYVPPKFIGADFSRADLSDANLTKVVFNGAIFSRAILNRTNLIKADFVRVNLNGAKLIEAKLNMANFIEAELVGAHLVKATLIEARLTGATLRGAIFSGADLKNADLRRVQALYTNFEGVNFSGACLEDWSINDATKLDNVTCDYIYLKANRQERRPHTGNFAPGEFTKLFQESLKTVDLIFSEGIDWKAFTYSFTNTQVVNENTSLVVQSIENKRGGTVVIRVCVPPSADKGKIHDDFWKGYEFAHKALESQYQARLEDKDKHINHLFNFVNQLQQKLGEVPKLMSETKKEYTFNAPVGSVGNEGNQAGVAGYVKGDNKTIQHNYPTEKRQTLAEAAEEIQKLLKQLEESNPNATEAEKQGYVNALVPSNNKTKIVSALQAGWKESIKELLDNSYLNVAIATLEGWQSAGK